MTYVSLLVAEQTTEIIWHEIIVEEYLAFICLYITMNLLKNKEKLTN